MKLQRKSLAEIVQQASANRELTRGNGQKILATAAQLSAKRAVLLKLLWVCDAMTLGHTKKLEPLAHLAIDRSGESAGLQSSPEDRVIQALFGATDGIV